MVYAILPSFLIIPSAIQSTITIDTVDDQELNPETSQFIPRTIRVAVYNESTDLASYNQGSMTYTHPNITAILNGAGYQVTQLSTNDILNHKLKTAMYDVFIMVDCCPADTIVNLTKEFWLGGGSLISFDTAICFLCYAGILPPESAGDNGFQEYFWYIPGDYEIYQRHPITKDYSVGDSFYTSSTRGTYNWTALSSTSIASDLVRLTVSTSYPDNITTLGYDPSNGGGRVVQMPFRDNQIISNMTDLIVDAVDWACPRPKGRILFDLSHMNAYGVDSYDYTNGYVQWSTSIYSELRDELVRRSYTFDKLYPSVSGNLTTNNLAPYDMLIINLPQTNFTASEITSVMNWVNNGGGLLALGDEYGYDGSKHLNYLLVSTGLAIIDVGPHTTLSTSFEHPTKEGCSTITLGTGDEVANTSNAFPLWGNSATEICIAGEEYGNGRIILSGDLLLCDDRIGLTNNRVFGINTANWLTASQAKVLYYTDHTSGPNRYLNPVPQALNDLKLPFYLTYIQTYLNLSLYKYNWDLVIVSCPSNGLDYDILIDYIDSGGRLIMDSYEVDDYPSHPLWAKLGFSLAADLPVDNPIYIWDPSHRIFITPAPYGADNFTQVLSAGDQGDLLTVYPNATALAGHTTTLQAGNATMVLRNDGRTLYNSFLLDQFTGDVDDSTYRDVYELWLNEIAYMTYQSLSVHINTPHPDDLFDATAPSFSITTDGIIIDELYYTLNGGANHPVTSNTGTINQGSWNALPEGSVSLEFYAEDTVGSSVSAGVNIEKDTQAPIIEILSPTSGQTFNETAPEFIVNITDPHLDKMWYTVNVSLANYTFTSNGTINQAAWEALSEGTVTITFYANDTLGHESFEQVSINFEIPSSKKKGIPGYDTYLIIGVISVISVLILENRLKRLKLNK